MKTKLLFILAAGVLLLSSISASAQVAMSIAVNRTNFLLYETIYVKVLLKNYSGLTLPFGDGDDSKGNLTFAIEMPDKTLAEQRKKAYNPMVGLILKPGSSQEVLVPITSQYVITKSGNFRVKATLSHKLLDTSYESNETTFSISNGIPVWEKSVGVPEIFRKSKDDKPLPRKMKIVTFNDGKDKVYSLIVDDQNFIYGVARIGSDIGNFPPTCEVDGLSRVHIMLQVSPSVFAYFIYDVNCDLSTSDVYVKTNTVPVLIVDEKEGDIMVLGGRRAVKDIDYIEENGVPKLVEAQN